MTFTKRLRDGVRRGGITCSDPPRIPALVRTAAPRPGTSLKAGIERLLQYTRPDGEKVV